MDRNTIIAFAYFCDPLRFIIFIERQMNYKKTAINLSFLLATLLPFISCTDTVIEEKNVINDIEIPFEANFRQDTVTYGKLPDRSARYIFKLDESSASITDPSKYSFRVDELLQLRATSDADSLRITSYSAQTIYDVTLEIYLPEFDRYISAAYLDSIPGFSQFEFKPSFIGRRTTYQTEDGYFLEFEYPELDMERMKPRLKSNDSHFRMLEQIDAQWSFSFSNYSWKEGMGETGSWLEMRPIFAREWVVIVTNYAYMMTTPEYRHVMENFNAIFGGDLYDNNQVSFTPEKYLSEMERYKQPYTFRLGRSGDSVGGLGGGSVWGITGWNYYGHYASYSGWEAITHEFMHCMGYGHSSNMTYASNNVGWTVFIWQLHLWLSHEKRLPYLDRNLLGFHKLENAEYRNNLSIRSDFQDDDRLEQSILKYYNSSQLVKYLNEHFITE